VSLVTHAGEILGAQNNKAITVCYLTVVLSDFKRRGNGRLTG
jgi:hypothetical protein